METVRVIVQSPLGVKLEVYVNTEDNIYLLKCKIARKRGIPVSQQHLMYNFKELSNSATLSSYSIGEGSILKLIVSLKNGMISDCGRNISTLDNIQWTDIKHFLENNKEEAVEWLHVGCKGLMIDEEEDDYVSHVLIDNPQIMFLPGIPLTEEDCVTKCKMIDVQTKMRELSIKRYEKSSFNNDYYTNCSSENCPCGEGSHVDSLLSGIREYYRKPINKYSYESSIQKVHNRRFVFDQHPIDCDCEEHFKCDEQSYSCSEEEIAKSILRLHDEIKVLPKIESSKVNATPDSSLNKESNKRNFLPPIDTKMKENGKRQIMGKTERVRCFMCRKRLSISTVHICQCGGSYCAPHRYSEVHNCKYDYSKEWQMQLHRANPSAYSLPKLPKI